MNPTNEDREEWSDEPGTIETDCEVCGERRLCRNLPDQCLAEFSPETDNPARWVCRECYVIRGYDM